MNERPVKDKNLFILNANFTSIFFANSFYFYRNNLINKEKENKKKEDNFSSCFLL